MSKEVQARAVVTMTLEIPLDGGGWGAECTIGQVHKQALDSAQSYLSQAMQRERQVNSPCFPAGTRIIGTPKVTKVLTDGGG